MVTDGFKVIELESAPVLHEYVCAAGADNTIELPLHTLKPAELNKGNTPIFTSCFSVSVLTPPQELL